MTRLLRTLAWFAIVMLLARPMPIGAQAQATGSSDIPGFGPIGPGAKLSYLISGELADEVAPGSHLVVERITLDAGDVIPTLDAGQILVIESGEVSLTDDLGLEASLEAGTQLFIASEGYRDLTATTAAQLLRANIMTSNLSKSTATPVPDALRNAETIFDQKLDAIDPGATLFVAEVELAGSGGSLGEQTYNGMTGMMVTGAPLMVVRLGHVPSKLPEKQGFFFPADTVATLSNESTPAATLLIAGIVVPASTEEEPPAASPESGSGAPSADNGQPSRPTTPGDQPAEPASLEAYLPDDNDVGPAGFAVLSTDPTTDVENSVFAGLANEPDAGGWETGLTRLYLPLGEWSALTGALVTVDQFDTVESATNAVMMFAIGSAIAGDPFDPPASATADQVVGFSIDVPEQSFTGTFIMAQYGNVVVTIVTGVPLHESGEEAALALWEVVDAVNR